MTDATLPAPIASIDDATAAELRRLCEAATPGPRGNACFQVNALEDRCRIEVAHTGMGQRPPPKAHESEANAVLIAAAVTALPRLLDARDAYERRIAALLRTNEMLQRDCDAQNERIGAARREALEEALCCFDAPVETWPTGWREKYPAMTLPSAGIVRTRIRALIEEPTS